MTKEDKHFDDLFREKVAGFAETPPAHVWDGIKSAQQAAKRKKLFFYLKLSGAAAAVVIAFVMGWQLANKPVEDLQPTEVVQAPLNEESLSEEGSVTETVAEETDKPSQDVTKSITTQEPQIIKKEIEPEKVSTSQNILTAYNNEPVVAKEETAQNEERESFQLLSALTQFLYDIEDSPKTNILEPVERKKEPQFLTAEDLKMIEENQQLLALNRSEKRKKLWQVAAMVAPSVSVNQTSYKETYASNMSNPGSKDNLSLGGGLAVTYKAGKRLSIQSGVYFSQLEQASSNTISNGGNRFQGETAFDFASSAGYFNTSLEVKSDQFLMNASAGVVEFDNLPSNVQIGNKLEDAVANEAVFLSAAEFQQNFEYIEIPLNLRYQLIDSKFGVNLLGGFSTNLLVGNDTYIENTQGRERIGQTRDMNKVSYSTTVGLGFGYGLTNKLRMHVEPQFKYFLGSLNDNSQVSFKPYTIGVYTGISYQF